MKVKQYKINEIEEKRGKATYSLELKIEFEQKKDREEFIKLVRDNLR